MRYCGSIETVSSYQRVKKEQSNASPNSRPAAGDVKEMRCNCSGEEENMVVMMKRMGRKRSPRGSSSNSSRTSMEMISMGKYLSENPDAPKLIGIASRRTAIKDKAAHSQTHFSLIELLEALMDLPSPPLNPTMASSSSSAAPPPHHMMVL